jgi:cell division protein FtsL
MFIALIQVFQSSNFTHTGQTLQGLQQQQTDLNANIHDLEAEVAALSSLDRTERAARDRLGMVPARNLTYLSVNVPAPDEVLVPRPIIQPTPQPSDTQPWWEAPLKILPKP